MLRGSKKSDSKSSVAQTHAFLASERQVPCALSFAPTTGAFHSTGISAGQQTGARLTLPRRTPGTVSSRGASVTAGPPTRVQAVAILSRGCGSPLTETGPDTDRGIREGCTGRLWAGLACRTRTARQQAVGAAARAAWRRSGTINKCFSAAHVYRLKKTKRQNRQ